MGDSQDIRFMGGLLIYMPFTSASLFVSNFALCCMTFLAGFYSMDFILEMFSIEICEYDLITRPEVYDLITRPEVSYLLWCAVVCDLETS